MGLTGDLGGKCEVILMGLGLVGTTLANEFKVATINRAFP